MSVSRRYEGIIPCTNQRTELSSIILALELTKKIEGHIIIATDSKYCIGIATGWGISWIKKGIEKCNMDLVNQLLDLL
jgi:ribonuclease HI